MMYDVVLIMMALGVLLLRVLVRNAEPVPHEETPPPELIKFTVEGMSSDHIVVDESATQREIYDLGLWLVRCPDLDVGYYIEKIGDNYQQAYATRGLGDSYRRLAGNSYRGLSEWVWCKDDDLGYVVWYEMSEDNYFTERSPVASINTDGEIESYNPKYWVLEWNGKVEMRKQVEREISGRISLDERCDYLGLEREYNDAYID